MNGVGPECEAVPEGWRAAISQLPSSPLIPLKVVLSSIRPQPHTMINAIEAAQVGSRDLEGGETKGGVGRVPQAEIAASPRGE